MKRFLPFVIVLLLLVVSVSRSDSLPKAQNRFNIIDITMQGFDRSTNQLFSLPQLPNPYGLDIDLLVSLEVSDNPDTSSEQLAKPQKATLSVDAKGYTTAATGEVPPWKESQTRTVFIASARGISYLPFIVEYKCYPDVIFTANLAGYSKSKRLSMPCAE